MYNILNSISFVNLYTELATVIRLAVVVVFFCFLFFLIWHPDVYNCHNNNNIFFQVIIHFIENQPVNIKIIISIKIFYSINCKNSSTSLFTYIKSKIMVIVTISIRK